VLEEAGFEVQTLREYSTAYPPGTVIGQDPAEGTRVPVGTTVVLVISSSDRDDRGGGGGGDDDDDDDTSTVPDVLGMTEEAARQRIIDAGFEVDVIHQRESSRGQARKHRNQVWKQSPAGGTEREQGSTVTIWVNPD
jgi:serine/threonine-protein kinase